MPPHNVMYDIDEANVATATGRSFKTANGYVLGWGTTVGNAVETWAPGAIFIDTNAGAGARVHVNTGTKTAAVWAVNAAEVLSAQMLLNLPLGSWTEQDGTALADFVAGASNIPGWSAGDESHGIRWNNAAAPDPISISVPIPPDLDETANVVMHILAAKTGATVGDAVTWLVEAFNNTVGALYDADADFGGTSDAMTGDATAKTVAELTLTLALADIAAAPGVMVFTLQPTDGTLGTDDVILLGVWLEYTRKVLTT